MSEESKYIQLTTKPVEKLILKLAVPTIISVLITTIYNMADTIFVGQINSSAQGAISVIFSYMAIVQAFGYFFGHGSGNYISRMLGDKNENEASKMSATGLIFAFSFGTALMIFGLFFINPLTVWLGSTPTIKPYAVSYLTFILFGTPFMMTSLVLNNQLRFQGSALYAMIGVLTGGILNIILDAIFVLCFNMGVMGVGLATMISQITSFILLVIGTFKGGNIRFKFNNITICKAYLKEIIFGGLPSLGRQGLASVSTICLSYLAKYVTTVYTDELISSVGVVSKLMQFFVAVLLGFGQGFQPVCGFNYGAKKYDRVLRSFFFCVVVGSVFSAVMTVIGLALSKPLLSLFSKDKLVISYATGCFISQISVLTLIAYTNISNMMLQNLGKVVRATLIATSRQGWAFIPILFTMTFTFKLKGFLLAQCLSEIVSFIISLPLSISVIKELSKLNKEQQTLLPKSENL